MNSSGNLTWLIGCYGIYLLDFKVYLLLQYKKVSPKKYQIVSNKIIHSKKTCPRKLTPKNIQWRPLKFNQMSMRIPLFCPLDFFHPYFSGRGSISTTLHGSGRGKLDYGICFGKFSHNQVKVKDL